MALFHSVLCRKFSCQSEEVVSLRRDFDLIQKTASRAAALTRQLLAFSRKQVLQPRVVDPNDLVGNSTNLLKRLIGEDIELVFMPPPISAGPASIPVSSNR